MLSVMEKWFVLIQEKLARWLEAFIKMLPNLLLAILIFTAFFFLAKFLRKVIYNLLLKISHKPTISGLFSSIFFIIILFVGLFISLQLLHLDKTISSLLAGAGIIGLALGFAFQDLTANFISGVFIIFKKNRSMLEISSTQMVLPALLKKYSCDQQPFVLSTGFILWFLIKKYFKSPLPIIRSVVNGV